ncbi:hypothetical protein ABIC74_000738 [Mucilaginibacter rubeus]|uniref:DUF4145 domain-containing protein n=1 Tax=Mucilaginibacter rubeus TaxID=2027860 RepID=UPI00339396E9
MKENKKIINYCVSCFKNTNHEVIHLVEEFHEDFLEVAYYTIVKCLGCDRYSYRTESRDVQNTTANPDDNIIAYENFPNVLKGHRNLKYPRYIPTNIAVIYKEALKAFAANCYLLTAVAFRGVIEAICVDKKIPGRELKSMITNLAKHKLISEKEAERLQPIRFMGNDSIHEAIVPTSKALYIVLDVVDHLINNLYIIDVMIKNDLETIVNNIVDFRVLLNKLLKNHKKGQELSLSEIFGKHHRRLLDKSYEFENELKDLIKKSLYTNLSLGKVTSNGDPKRDVQYYKIEDIADDDPYNLL